jgi:hypothetical protein
VHRKYIQQDETSHSLFISANCSTCFGWYFHPSSGAPTTVSTAFGICRTVTAICRYRGRVGTGLSVLWVAYYRGRVGTGLSVLWVAYYRGRVGTGLSVLWVAYAKYSLLDILQIWVLALLVCYANHIGILPTFQESLSVTCSRFKNYIVSSSTMWRWGQRRFWWCFLWFLCS